MASDELTTLLVELGLRLERQEQQIEAQARQIEAQAQRIEALETENATLKELLQKAGAKKGSKAPKFTENYSVEKHQGKGKSKRGQQSTGRRPQASKLKLVECTLDVYEAGVLKSACVERGCQYVWRIIDGKARYVSEHFNYGMH